MKEVGESVGTDIYNLHDIDIGKNISLWNQNYLGNIKTPGSYCIASSGTIDI